MTLECRNKHYNKISQILNKFLKEFNKKVSIGSNCPCLESKIIAITHAKDIIRCYRPYLAELTYIYSLSIAREGSASVTVDLDIGADNFTYTGVDNAEGILLNLQAQLDNNTIFETYLSNNVLYIYSYSDTIDFSTATDFTSSLTTTVGTLTNYEDNPNILLNLWNCLTSTELCQLINSIYELQPDC